MAKSLSGGTSRLWISDQAPTVSEEDVERGNFFQHGTDLYFCADETMDMQVWILIS